MAAMRDQAIGQPDVSSLALADQALITQVLPKARDRAKDLGIINIAIVCPGAIGAVIAAPLVSLAGYPALFGATAVVAIAASIGVWRIQSVR
jgi:hypothetical protein